MSTPTLFIGGPKDGVRQDIAGVPEYWHVETMPGLANFMRNPPPDPEAKAVRETYRYVLLVGEPAPIGIYVHSSVTNWVEALVDGYREARK